MKAFKKIFCGALSILSVLSASASGNWTLQGTAYKVDTLSHVYIGPGTTETSLQLSGGSKLRIFYTTTDLTNPNVDVRALKHGDKWAAVTTVSSAAKNHSTSTRSYFAGVNADFFANSAPCGINIVDGEVVCNAQSYGWNLFGITDAKVPLLGVGDMSFSLIRNGATTQIDGLNITRSSNYLVLYSKWKSTTSETNAYGSEVTLLPVSGKIASGAVVTMKVGCAPVANVGAMTIPDGGYVLSGHGTAATFINGLTQGEEVQVKCTLNFDGVDGGKVMQAVGGKPMIVSGGKVLETQSALDHLVALNPRTAVGYNADKTKLVMLVVDGRSTISAGVVSKVLADIMINVGCTEAMNFDGGGSSTLYTKDFGVLNVPSDGTERAVTNGLYLATEAPADNTVASIHFVDFSKELPRYGTFTPKFYGYNQYGVLVNKDVQGVELSCEKALGTISTDKKSVTAEGTGYQLLTATYNGTTATLPVKIVDGVVKCRLASVIEDGFKGYPVEVVSQSGTDMIPVDRTKLTWTSDDPTIATVDEYGVLHGVMDGITTVRGTLGTYTATLPVTIQMPTDHVQSIDPLNEIDKWTVTMSGGTNKVVTAYEKGFSLDFTGSTSRSCYVKMSRDIDVWSLPDSLKFTVNPGDVAVTSLKVAYRANGSAVSVYTLPLSLKANMNNEIRVATSDLFDESDRGNYPIQLSYIYYSLTQPTANSQFKMLFPAIEGVYNAIHSSSGINGIEADKGLSIYPNPVSQGDNVKIFIQVGTECKVRVNNISGQLIAEYNLPVVDKTIEVNTATWGKGLFLVTVKTPSFSKTAKVLVK